MASDAESLVVENQEEHLQDLTDEQLEQLLHDTLLVRIIIFKPMLCPRISGAYFRESAMPPKLF